MMADQQPRYEYRIWTDRLETLKDELQRLAGAVFREQASEETYLISTTSEDSNVKIRGGRLNIKDRMATDRGLELWRPILDAVFPLDASVIADQVFPRLKVRAPDLYQPRYSIDQLREVIEPLHQVTIVRALKRRTRFQLVDCLAEYTLVAVGKMNLETVALEANEPDPVLRMIDRLQIAGIPNTSYVRQLGHILSDNPDTVSVLSRNVPTPADK